MVDITVNFCGGRQRSSLGTDGTSKRTGKEEKRDSA